MVTKVPKTGKETVVPAELATRADAMQTRKPALKFMRAANRSLQVPANIGEKAGGVDAPPVDRRPLAACAAVDDTGMAQN